MKVKDEGGQMRDDGGRMKDELPLWLQYVLALIALGLGAWLGLGLF